MKSVRLFVLAACLMAFPALARTEPRTCDAPLPAAAPLDAATSQRIDALFDDVPRTGAPGYAIGVLRRGTLVYARGFGQANLDDGIAITPQTSFHLASLSKQFTGAAIALLLQDGKLSLDDPVGQYLPEAKKFGPGLQIRHLVYMTSGIRDYTERPRASGLPWFTGFYFTREEAIAAALAPPALDFAPGEKWRYSNVNYMLLTRIVEVVSGQRYSEFMRDRVFAPLCMDATHVDDDTTRVVPRRAIGYAARSPQIVEAGHGMGVTILPGPGYARMLRVSPHFGGSGVFSTVQDIARWDRNFEHPTLGGEAFIQQMQAIASFPHGKHDDAFGLVLGSHKGHPMWWYAGGDVDGSAYLARFSEDRFTVVCLSNLNGGDCEGRARRVIDVLIANGEPR